MSARRLPVSVGHAASVRSWFFMMFLRMIRVVIQRPIVFPALIIIGKGVMNGIQVFGGRFTGFSLDVRMIPGYQ